MSKIFVLVNNPFLMQALRSMVSSIKDCEGHFDFDQERASWCWNDLKANLAIVDNQFADYFFALESKGETSDLQKVLWLVDPKNEAPSLNTPIKNHYLPLPINIAEIKKWLEQEL